MYALPPAVPGTASARGLDKAALPAKSRQQTTVSTAPVVVQKVSLDHTPARTDLLADVDEWTWVELRDYVVAEIINRFGPFPRDARKEYGIFNRFFNEYGKDGVAIAKYAFGPACDGWWAKAPISINRFCKGSDSYFAAPILERLADVADR